MLLEVRYRALSRVIPICRLSARSVRCRSRVNDYNKVDKLSINAKENVRVGTSVCLVNVTWQL